MVRIPVCILRQFVMNQAETCMVLRSTDLNLESKATVRRSKPVGHVYDAILMLIPQL